MTPQPKRKFYRETEKKRYKALKKEFGNKKKLPRGYGLQALVALSYYPELKDISIEFIFENKINSLSTFPASSTIVLPAKEKIYQIIISKKIRKSKEPVLLRNLSFNSQVGVFGHELAHVADFIRKSTIGLIKDGILYFIPPFQAEIEKSTDLAAIEHGLGYQLLDYALLINKLKVKYPDEKYYWDYDKTYLNSNDILQKINALEIYK
jgi:hypothetical protein